MKYAKAVKSVRILILVSALLLSATSAFAKVLIIQDSLPWSVDYRQAILDDNGISHDEINSSEIGDTDLSTYTMIIMPSTQGSTYYSNWNSNLSKIEEYVQNGGKLWQSTCDTAGSTPVPMIPGGVISATDLDYYNDIVAPKHPWVKGASSPLYGNRASYNSYTNLYPGSTIIATAQTSGLPVLVDYRYGAGRVFITSQPLEWAWYIGWNAKPIIENSLVNLYYADLTQDVLIIQDTVPFSGLIGGPTVNPIHYIFADKSINYYQITSAQISTIEFSPFAMIVMPSVQGNTFYANWNANITKIETYVRNGGKLWQSTSNKLSTATEPKIPGNVTNNSDFDFFNTISMPAHPWVQGVPNPMFGNAANHDSFTNLYKGSKVIAKTQMSKKPVLVDFRYYAGRILITGQPLEYAWHFEQDGKPILENSLIELLKSNDEVLIIQDKAPWNSTAIQEILDLNSINYDQISSSKIKSTDLTPYKMVIFPSVQGNTYYTNLNKNIAKIESYVKNAGKLWQSACNQSSSTEPLIPGGVVSSSDSDNYNVITAPQHPWVKGVPNPMYGNSANHDSFTNLYSESKVIATTQNSGHPVLVDYRYGEGRIFITGQTLEYSWNVNLDGKPILENSLLDLYYSKDFSWNLFLPAILIHKSKL